MHFRDVTRVCPTDRPSHVVRFNNHDYDVTSRWWIINDDDTRRHTTTTDDDDDDGRTDEGACEGVRGVYDDTTTTMVERTHATHARSIASSSLHGISSHSPLSE